MSYIFPGDTLHREKYHSIAVLKSALSIPLPRLDFSNNYTHISWRQDVASFVKY